MTSIDDLGGNGPRLPTPPVNTGVLPVLPPGVEPLDNNSRSNAATAASAAGMRAFTAQAVAFYFRAPAKAFFRMRVDYLAFARNIHLERQRQLQEAAAASPSKLKDVVLWLRGTTPGVLTTAIRQQGWSVVPEHVLPPLMANVAVGAVLYSSYLHILGHLHEESSRATKRVYPPPCPQDTFAAGFMAGCIQSFVAAPLDAIQARYDHRAFMGAETTAASTAAKPPSMWTFGSAKLREIGLRGVFAGWSMSLAKDSFGNAVFFSTFEYVKAQSYYKFVKWYYGDLSEAMVDVLSRRRPSSSRLDYQNLPNSQAHISAGDDLPAAPTVIRPHYAIEPAFLLAAGVSASIAQQVAVYPISQLQLEHFNHLEDLDAEARRHRASPEKRGWSMWRAYYRAYQETWAQCSAVAKSEGRHMASWLYRGFWWNTLRQVPSTSAGLIIFELVRRKYGLGGDEVRITKDGYDILLS
ncbi:hypothetical protein MCOR25_004278 [Pyricularia grisea]|nr:hypothetical protein MCOR25_004278 [Pyricularia grisea]